MVLRSPRFSEASSLILVLAGSLFAGIRHSFVSSSRNEANALTISGKDDIKMDWISEMRNDCGENCPKIVPRVNWQASAIHDEVSFLLKEYNC